MRDKITRRDFLNGAALSVAATALAPYSSLAFSTTAKGKEYYPPLLTGMRGSHKGSFEVAHALVMGGQRPEQYEPVDELYDLVIVGGGISGLSAAYLYKQQMGPDVKILVLDNHDDFGGHAKRNEFESSGKMLLSPGGSLNLEQSAFSAGAYQVLEDIGVDFKALQDAGPDDYGLSNAAAPYGIYLNKNLYGKDTIIPGDWGSTWAGAGDYKAMIKSLDLSKTDTSRLIALVSGEKDYLPDIPLSDKETYMRSTSYATFLNERVGLSRQGAKLTEPWVRAIWGVGISSASIMEAIELGAPGANAMGFPESDGESDVPEDPNAYRSPMFPDGNASVARLFVNKLIPQVAGADSMEELVASRFDYSQLDLQDAPVRIRLNSTVVNVANRGSDLVDISYVSGDRAFRVQGRHCILAGYNGMIPHLCPDLPETQKENLAYGSKVPFICANVVLKSSAPVRKSGASLYVCADSFFELVTHAPPVNLGAYQVSTKPNDPMVLYMLHMPAPEGDGKQSGRDLCRLGRHKIMATSFADYEREIRYQLNGMFGEAGFDADRDIEAITINRWSHGYAYEYMDLHDPRWEPDQAPHELGRQPFGRISIANSDSEAYAYVQSAIDASIRAVGGGRQLTLLQHRVLNGWPLFYLIALLTLGGMIAGMLIIGISSPEATVKLIRLSVQFASPWIFIAFVTSALVTLFPGAISQWLLRNRRYTGLSFAAGFAWQAVFIAVLLHLYPAYYWDELHKTSDLVGRSLSYVLLLALAVTSFYPVRRKMSRAQWHWLHLIGIWYFWAAIWVSYAEQALSQNAKTIDGVFVLLGLLVLILRLAAHFKTRGIIAIRKST